MIEFAENAGQTGRSYPFNHDELNALYDRLRPYFREAIPDDLQSDLRFAFTEVQAKLRLKELGEPVSGDMLITSGVQEAEEPIKIAQSSDVDFDPSPPAAAVSLEDATAAFRAHRHEKDKVWCEQCERQVTPGQAVSCKSKYCTAKAVA